MLKIYSKFLSILKVNSVSILEAPLYISEKDTPFKAGKSAQKLVI
jgi:hypothetical protein